MESTPAYPSALNTAYTRGLSKRELIAAMALQGLIARLGGWTYENASAKAVDYADALLKELAKEPSDE